MVNLLKIKLFSGKRLTTLSVCWSQQCWVNVTLEASQNAQQHLDRGPGRVWGWLDRVCHNLISQQIHEESMQAAPLRDLKSNQSTLLILQGEILLMQQQTVHIISYLIDNKIEDKPKRYIHSIKIRRINIYS